MPESPFYRDVPRELSQGDIFERVPLVYFSGAPRSLRDVPADNGRSLFELEDPLDPAHPPRPVGLRVATECDFTRGILLTYDCEIDKPATKHLTLALVRPLDPSMPEQSRRIVRENRKFSAFYLPAGAEPLHESFVDFIRLSTLPKDFLKASPRIGCLSEEARQAMLFQLIRFLCRKDLSAAMFQPSP